MRVEELRIAKARVAGSNPVFRSKLTEGPVLAWTGPSRLMRSKRIRVR